MGSFKTTRADLNHHLIGLGITVRSVDMEGKTAFDSLSCQIVQNPILSLAAVDVTRTTARHRIVDFSTSQNEFRGRFPLAHQVDLGPERLMGGRPVAIGSLRTDLATLQALRAHKLVPFTVVVAILTATTRSLVTTTGTLAHAAFPETGLARWALEATAADLSLWLQDIATTSRKQKTA